METTLSVIALVVGILGSGVAWLVSDSRSKARNEITERTVTALQVKVDAHADRLTKVEALAEHVDDKHDGLKEDLREMRTEISARFDRLEAVMRGDSTANTRRP